MDTKKIGRELDEFIASISKEFGPCEILLFGSRARGDDWKRSDYDLILVSEKFEGVHWLDRISSVLKHWTLMEDVDVLPYTPDEFEMKKKESSFVRHIVKESVVLN